MRYDSVLREQCLFFFATQIKSLQLSNSSVENFSNILIHQTYSIAIEYAFSVYRENGN